MTKDPFLELWHKWLGHPSDEVVRLIPYVKCSSRHHNKKACDVCMRAKQPRFSFPISRNKATEPFELIHCDLWGAYRTPSSCGAVYFLAIVDDYSRVVWVYLLSNKLEVKSMFLAFVAMVQRQFNKQIKRVISDNGTEFNCLRDYFHDHGILFETSCVKTPQQNGRVEWKYRHLLNVGRCALKGICLCFFWGECIFAACYLINRTSTPLLQNKTPYEMLFGKTPSYDFMRVFGCLCYVHNQNHRGDKFVSRSRRCVFVGYPFRKKRLEGV